MFIKTIAAIRVFAVLSLIAPAGSLAYAGSFTVTSNGSSCSGCPPATYQLQVIQKTATTYTVTLTIDSTFSGSNSSAGNYILGVDFDFFRGDGTAVGTLTQAPGGTTNWTTKNGPLSDSGCGNASGSSICSEASSTTAAPDSASRQLVWVWNVALSGNKSTQSTNVHIGANYDPPKGLIVADTASATPEPGSLALLGASLLSVAGITRRRRS